MKRIFAFHALLLFCFIFTDSPVSPLKLSHTDQPRTAVAAIKKGEICPTVPIVHPGWHIHQDTTQQARPAQFRADLASVGVTQPCNMFFFIMFHQSSRRAIHQKKPCLNLISMEGSCLKQGEPQCTPWRKVCEISLARLGSAFKLQEKCLTDSSALHRSFSPSLGFKPVNSGV